MAQYVSGSDDAFRELFRLYAPLLLGYMRRGYLGEEDARDLVQQTFLQLHRARHDFRSGAALRPWLMTIARNVKRDHFRREQRRDPVAPLLDELGRTDARFARAELREWIARCVDRLPAALACIVRGHWFEGRTYDAIARSLGISSGAAKVRATPRVPGAPYNHPGRKPALKWIPARIRVTQPPPGA